MALNGLRRFDPHFFATKRSHMFLDLNSLFIYSLFFRNELAKLATEAEFLVVKVRVLVALATVLVAILSPVVEKFIGTGYH